VNLAPQLPPGRVDEPAWVWGDAISFLRGADVLAVNHEATLAGVGDTDPATIQFEDPLNYLDTYGDERGVGVDFMAIANNHQFDYHDVGTVTTLTTLRKMNLAHGGVGLTAADVRAPVVVVRGGRHIAFFTMVIDECYRYASNNTLYLDGCTCGDNAGAPPPYQCRPANGTALGLWYHWRITDAFIDEASAVVEAHKRAHREHVVVAFLHVGPNFQWHPYRQHEYLLRNLSYAGADVVWGTSSHHVQRFEWFDAPRNAQTNMPAMTKPIIYGLGDLLFRHVVGVDDFCPLYAIPCQAYNPALALTYRFTIAFDNATTATPRVLPQVRALGTRHTEHQTFAVSQSADVSWLIGTFDALAVGAKLVYTGTNGIFDVVPTTQHSTP